MRDHAFAGTTLWLAAAALTACAVTVPRSTESRYFEMSVARLQDDLAQGRYGRRPHARAQRLAGREGIDAALASHGGLDVLVAPTMSVTHSMQ